MRENGNKQKLSTIMRRSLNFMMIIVIVIATVINLLLQNQMQTRHSYAMIDQYLLDYVDNLDYEPEIMRYFDRWMEDAIDGENTPGKEAFFDNERLQGVSESNHALLSEISIVDQDGNVAYSSNPGLIGSDLHRDGHLSDFLCLLDSADEYADQIYPAPYDETTDMVYIGRAFRDKTGFVLFGLNEEAYRNWRDHEIQAATRFTRIGTTGYLINCNLDKSINSVTYNKEGVYGEYLPENIPLPEQTGVTQRSVIVLDGEKCYVSSMKEPDYYIIGVYPVNEADQFRVQNNIIVVILFLGVLTAFFTLLFLMLKRIVLKEVERTHEGLKRITDGDLDTKVDAGGSREFVELSKGINETVDKLKELIRKEKESAEIELENARSIQTSAVPGTFPAFPEHQEFGIFASMDTAEAVGGDFYDFFLKDEDTLVIVMADVSGKGMPAALYMMRAKTLIRTYAEQGMPVEKVAEMANQKLCEDDAAAMFVTAWIGFLHLNTGKLEFIHAGHTYPVLVRKPGTEREATEQDVFLVEKEIDMVLGGMEEMSYLRQEITLQHGDSIYLYTDGVTEAMDMKDQTYDEDRLLRLIREKASELPKNDKNAFCKAACEMVYDDVKRFSAGAMQHDDITMMWVEY